MNQASDKSIAHTAPYPVTAVILAGGKGRRLQGQDKGLVHFQNRPIIDILLEAIAPYVVELFINANRNLDTYADYGYPVIRDDRKGFQGPLAGISTALSQASTSHILTLPCDGPLLTAAYVNRMCHFLTTSETPAKATTKMQPIVAHDGKRLQAVHALIPVSIRDDLETFLHSGKRGVGEWLLHSSVIYRDCSDHPEWFQNINTPAQLDSLQQAALRRREI